MVHFAGVRLVLEVDIFSLLQRVSQETSMALDQIKVNFGCDSDETLIYEGATTTVEQSEFSVKSNVIKMTLMLKDLFSILKHTFTLHPLADAESPQHSLHTTSMYSPTSTQSPTKNIRLLNYSVMYALKHYLNLSLSWKLLPYIIYILYFSIKIFQP